MIHRVARKSGLILLAGATLCRVYGQSTPTYSRADQADAILVGEVQSGQQSGKLFNFTLGVVNK